MSVESKGPRPAMERFHAMDKRDEDKACGGEGWREGGQASSHMCQPSRSPEHRRLLGCDKARGPWVSGIERDGDELCMSESKMPKDGADS
jgi:hypothetical protein